ncbi:MAG: 4Fe-4S binding protein [Anaerolineae bacterium]|nr:4Fe-4S binding protein [Anaerolineae bacterium]
MLFLLLLVGAGRTGPLTADSFFRLDPLVGLLSMVAARQVMWGMLIGALVALGAALIVGRAWCGWLCPLGTLLDWAPARKAQLHETDPRPWLRQVKYFVLLLLIVLALLGNLTFLIFDPITLLYRTITAGVWPALVALIGAVEPILYRIPPLQGPIDAFEGAARGALLPVVQPVYGLGIAFTLLLIGILALNLVRERFWCRYLCPLGGLLGLVSKVALLRRTVGTTCIECQRCARACPTGTIEEKRHFASDPSECTMCLECVPVCARRGQHFTWHRQPAAWRAYDPTRRQLFAATGAAVAAVGLFAAEPAARAEHPFLIRPPGSRKPEFLAQCIRCGICVRVCPTAGLQPAFAQAGWRGLWTPVLVPRLGHCDYGCNACGQACPTGAIPPLALAEKRITVIGHAYVDRSRCIPWVDGRNCIVCEEMCPLPEKAIVLEDAEVRHPDTGEPVIVRRPVVIHERCIGCGICENRCPVNGQAAIRVYAPTDLSAIG